MKKSTQTPTSIVYKTGNTPVRYTPFKETKDIENISVNYTIATV